MPAPLPIFFTFDDNYVVPAGVTFESLLSNARPGVSYALNVLHQGISASNQRLLADLVARHPAASLRFIDVKERFRDLVPEMSSGPFSAGDTHVTFTRETLFRCLPMMVPEFDSLDTILYSDVDVCVVDDISDVFGTELGDDYVAGCRVPGMLDYQFGHIPERLRSCYLAGGIWLMNLRRMRADGLGRRILDIMRNPPGPLPWNDQDVMNLACDGKVRFLSYRYCSIPTWRRDLAARNYSDVHYSRGELLDAMVRPKILHYAHIKPWKEPCAGDDAWAYWLSKSGLPAPSTAPRPAPLTSITTKLFGILTLPPRFSRSIISPGAEVFSFLRGVIRVEVGRTDLDK